MTREASDEELFLVPGESGEKLLYAPLRRAVIALNEDAVSSVARYVNGGDDALTEADAQVIDQIRTIGLFSAPYPNVPTSPADYLFKPHQVTLFPTTRCNLRCIYCYANAGSRSQDMPWEIARAAIDFVIENALSVGRKDFIVGFHGGGEPMVAWDLVKRATLYAHERAVQANLQAHVHSATNGVLSSTQRKFIASHFAGVNISMDGPRDVQDRQRPLANGSGSFDRVAETVRYFQEVRFPFGIRATLTEKSGHRFSEFLRVIHDLCPSLDQVHVEPVWECGRCITSGERPPEEADFLDRFSEAMDLARELGLSVFYSGARLDMLTNQFCAAPGDGFAVTPEGLVTSCFEVTDPTDHRAELFHYGRYDSAAGGFQFSAERLEALRRLRVENIPYCGDCFCKWHCAGDCYAKALPGTRPDGHAGSPRCHLNRELTRKSLLHLVKRHASTTDAEAH